MLTKLLLFIFGILSLETPLLFNDPLLESGEFLAILRGIVLCTCSTDLILSSNDILGISLNGVRDLINSLPGVSKGINELDSTTGVPYQVLGF